MTNEPIDADFRQLTPYERALPGLADGAKVKDHPIVKSLLRKTPREVIIQGYAGPYLPWAYYARVLTETFGPMWTTEVLKTEGIPATRKTKSGPKQVTEVVAHVRLVTPFGSQPGVGSMDFDPTNANATMANTEKGAVSLALANAAGRYGIGGDVKASVEESAEAQEVREAEERWRAALREAGLTEKAAVQRLGRDGKLPTLRDCLDATGRVGADAYDVLRDELGRMLEVTGP